MSSHPVRFRLALFLFYLSLYFGFVLTAAIAPDSLEWTPLLGINIAIWYGFLLIGAAIVLSIVYGWQASQIRQVSNRERSSESLK